MKIEFVSSDDAPKINNIMALPPEHQTAREKEAILKDERLIKLLGETKVCDIVKTQNGYTLSTSSGKEIFVGIKYIPSGIGPAKFELIFPEETQAKSASSKTSLRKWQSEQSFFQKSRI